MAEKKRKIPQDRNIIDYPMEEAMPDNYLPYAVEVAKDRALPDVRDGLKPVHRRILYGAYLLKAFPDKPFYKSARIVGDIMGKFHPHGDSSVYDAMTILAQSFSTREPLIDGHGNWGSIDGDSAAAMRYTEARLSPIAMELLRDIEMDTVEFVPNYSDIETEPTVLPSRFPNLLVNGSFGIAVGLSTNIPPHNLGEVIDGTCALIDKPELTTAQLMKYIKGPDLPTGGFVIGKDALLAAYETGEGKAVHRAKCHIETLDNGRYAIVITEFPFRKNKSRIVQTISEMTGDKRHQKALEAIAEIRDESGRNGIRAVIELKKSTSEEHADKILKYILKKTDLQSNLSFNMVAIDNGKPKTFGLKGMIEAYIAHQKEILTRRTKKELETAERRYHIVQGFMKAISIMDELIKTIRASKNKADANKNIREKFGFTEIQAIAILELMLYRLTGLELSAFIKESEELEAKIASLKEILSDSKVLEKLLKKELKEIKTRYANPRRTVIIDDEEVSDISYEELIVAEDSMVTLSREGFIKKIPMKSYNRSSSDADSVELREGDELQCIFKTNTLDDILIFTDLGNMYRLKSMKIPEMKWKEKGVRFDEIIRVSQLDEEKIVSAFSLPKITESMVFKILTDKGGIKRTLGENLDSNYSKLVAIKLGSEEKVFGVIIEDGMNLVDNRINNMLPENKGEGMIPDSADILYSITDEEEDQSFNTEFLNIPMFIRVMTKEGLNFTVPEGECEIKDKMIIPDRFASIPKGDRIVGIKYEYDFELKEISLEITPDGKIRKIEGRKPKAGNFTVKGISDSELVFITSTGLAIKVPGYTFEDIHGEADFLKLFAIEDKKDRIINVFVREGFDEGKSVILASDSGNIKKMDMDQIFEGSDQFSVAKFRNDSERLVMAQQSLDAEDKIILISSRGMAIKFPAKQLSSLGRTAIGVTGMSLKEDDRLAFGCLEKENMNLTIKSNAGAKVTLKASDLKTQNRAGKGVTVLKTVLNEEIKEVLVTEL